MDEQEKKFKEGLETARGFLDHLEKSWDNKCNNCNENCREILPEFVKRIVQAMVITTEIERERIEENIEILDMLDSLNN